MTEKQTLQQEVKENNQNAVLDTLKKSKGFKFRQQSLDISCSNTWNNESGLDAQTLTQIADVLSHPSSSSSSCSSSSSSSSSLDSVYQSLDFGQNSHASTAWFSSLVKFKELQVKEKSTLEDESIKNGVEKEEMQNYKICAEKGSLRNPSIKFNRPENSLALTLYTAESIFEKVNKLLREGEGPRLERFQSFLPWCLFLTNFTEAWRALPRQTETILYRGMSAPCLSTLLQWCTVSSFIRFEAYTSASLDIEVALQMKNHLQPGQTFLLFKIKSLSGRLIQDFSLFPEEKEVVFRAGTTFKTIASCEQKLDGDTFYVVEIEEYFPQIGRKNILWCETNFKSAEVNNIYQTAERTAGVTFFEATSTARALNLLNFFLNNNGPLRNVGPDRFRIIQNMTRKEKPIEKVLFPDEKVEEEDTQLDIEAGLKLVQLLWGFYGYQFPLCVFTSSAYLKENKKKFEDFPYVLVTDSIATCMDFACFGPIEETLKQKRFCLSQKAQKLVERQVELAFSSIKKWTSFEQDVATSKLKHIDSAKTQLLTSIETKLKTDFEIHDKSVVKVGAYEFSIPVFETKIKNEIQKEPGEKTPECRMQEVEKETTTPKILGSSPIEETTQVAVATIHRTTKPNTFTVVVPKAILPTNHTSIGFKVKIPSLFSLPQDEAAEVTVFLNVSDKDPTQGVLAGRYQFDQKGWTIEKSWLNEAKFMVVPLFDSSCSTPALSDCGCIKLVFHRGVKTASLGYSPTPFCFQAQDRVRVDSFSLLKETQKNRGTDDLKRKLESGTEIPRFRKDGTAATVIPHGRSSQYLHSVPGILVRPETKVEVYLQIQISL